MGCTGWDSEDKNVVIKHIVRQDRSRRELRWCHCFPASMRSQREEPSCSWGLAGAVEQQRLVRRGLGTDDAQTTWIWHSAFAAIGWWKSVVYS